jgi:hypothetical protein
MQKLKKTYKGIPLWVIALLLCAGIAAASVIIISNIWISPKITVIPPPPQPLNLFSPDLTQDQTIQVDVPLEYHMTLENPNTDYTYTRVHVIVEIRDLSDGQISPGDVTVQYYDPTATPGYEWKTITFEQRTEDGNTYLYHDWAAYGFDMPPSFSITILFKATYHTAGVYQGEAYAVQG